jgi:hypothetical protein
LSSSGHYPAFVAARSYAGWTNFPELEKALREGDLRTVLLCCAQLVDFDAGKSAVERSFIRQALKQAVDRGLITRQQIRNARMSGPSRKIVEAVLRRVA